MNTLEIIGFITGIAGIWLTIKQNIWCFPVGLINVSISLLLFFEQKLYSDVLQQFFYIILLTYGWINWKQLQKRQQALVTSLNNTSRALLAVVVSLLAASMGYFFSNYTDADVPYLDAFATACSFAAQYLIARKKIENWPIWVLVNVMYIGIYFYKDLYLYAVLFFVYLALAIYGWNKWLQTEKTPVRI